jgi:hypothetical protein
MKRSAKKINLILAFTAVALVVGGLGIATSVHAADEYPSEVTLFKNVNIFDGVSEQLKTGYDVMVVGNTIHKIAKDIPTSGSYEVEVTTGGPPEVRERSLLLPIGLPPATRSPSRMVSSRPRPNR